MTNVSRSPVGRVLVAVGFVMAALTIASGVFTFSAYSATSLRGMEISHGVLRYSTDGGMLPGISLGGAATSHWNLAWSELWLPLDWTGRYERRWNRLEFAIPLWLTSAAPLLGAVALSAVRLARERTRRPNLAPPNPPAPTENAAHDATIATDPEAGSRTRPIESSP